MRPPSPTASSPTSESDIEMLSLDDLAVPSKSYAPGDTSQSHPDDHDSDDDDGGERALLGENTETRWKGKPSSIYLGFWKQTSGIVVEVSVSSLQSRFADHGTPDTSNAPFHDIGQSIYGGAVF
jgi:hypothetical protein